LFKKRHPKRLPGFEDFLVKLRKMGLQHLIQSKSQDISTQKKSKTVKSQDERNVQWWYIGE